MKKKAKLIATLSSLGLALAMMVFAVYAATSVTFKVTTNVSFEATKHVQATILAMHTVALEDAPTDADYNTNDVTGANQIINVDENGNTTGTITDVVFGARELTASNNHYGYKIEITNNDDENDLPISVTLPESQTGTGYEVTWSEIPTSITKNGGKVVITCHIEIKDLAGNSVTVKNEDMALEIMLGEEEAPEPTLDYLTFDYVDGYYSAGINVNELKKQDAQTYSMQTYNNEFDGKIVFPAIHTGDDGTYPVKEINGNMITAYMGELMAEAEELLESGVLSGEDEALEYMFSKMNYLQAITYVYIPQGIEIIGTYALAFTGIENINIPRSVKKLNTNSIMYTNLRSIAIPSSVEEIGDYAFGWNSQLKDVYINSKVSGYKTFMGCPNIENVIISYGLEVLEGCVFSGCSELKLILPNSVTTINSEAFQTNFQWVVIPSSVVNVQANSVGGSTIVFIDLTEEFVMQNWDNGWQTYTFAGNVYYKGQWSMVDGVPTPN